jgi:hypothetical protein
MRCIRHGLCCPTKRASRPSRTPGQRDTEAIRHPGGGGAGGALPQTPEQKYRLIYLSAAAPAPTPSDEGSKTDAPPAPWTPSDRGLPTTDSAVEATGVATTEEALVKDEAGEVVLGYCAAVRGMLNDSQGGPLHPPGVRMREALQDVRDSLERNLQAKKGGRQRRCSNVWPVALTADSLSHEMS